MTAAAETSQSKNHNATAVASLMSKANFRGAGLYNANLNVVSSVKYPTFMSYPTPVESALRSTLSVAPDPAPNRSASRTIYNLVHLVHDLQKKDDLVLELRIPVNIDKIDPSGSFAIYHTVRVDAESVPSEVQMVSVTAAENHPGELVWDLVQHPFPKAFRRHQDSSATTSKQRINDLKITAVPYGSANYVTIRLTGLSNLIRDRSNGVTMEEVQKIISLIFIRTLANLAGARRETLELTANDAQDLGVNGVGMVTCSGTEHNKDKCQVPNERVRAVPAAHSAVRAEAEKCGG
ncbi:hypothetical protein C8R47DRAFT_1080954 [Mycena vitilis]|nr:hypothetical protein C8R47DRAFT_1080954 [Mycena vitilis]